MPQTTSKEQFDRQAAHYDKQWNSWSEETLDWLVAASDAKSTDHALDIATGAGFTACALAPLVEHVTGTDVSTGMLNQAQQRADSGGLTNITFIEAPAESLPFEDASMDIVSCRIAAHHFLDVPKFLSEVARVLKSGGRFLLVDTTVPDDQPHIGTWQNETELLRDASHKQNLSAKAWQELVESVGLEVVESTTSGNGITIQLDDWLKKSGTPEDRANQVIDRFENASDDIKSAFKIVNAAGVVEFTWMRLLLKAVKA